MVAGCCFVFIPVFLLLLLLLLPVNNQAMKCMTFKFRFIFVQKKLYPLDTCYGLKQINYVECVSFVLRE